MFEQTARAGRVPKRYFRHAKVKGNWHLEGVFLDGKGVLGEGGGGGRSDSPTVSFPRRTKTKKSVRVSLQWNAIFVFYETTDEYQGRLKLVFCFGGLLPAGLLGGLLVPAPTSPFRPPPPPPPSLFAFPATPLPPFPSPSRTQFLSTRFVCVYRTRVDLEIHRGPAFIPLCGWSR